MECMGDRCLNELRKKFNEIYDVSSLDMKKITIKEAPEDFIVEEIIPADTVCSTSDPKSLGTDWIILKRDTEIECNDTGTAYLMFILQKRNWDTVAALRQIAKRLRVSWMRFSFAGTKDKVSVSTQLISGYKIRKEDMNRIRIKDIQINSMWYSDDRVILGDLLGNRFTVIATVSPDLNIPKDLNALVNLFGPQRFGTTRRHNHIIGYLIVKGKFKEAVWAYLTDTTGETNKDAIEARKLLTETGSIERAIRVFPKHLRYERIILQYLSKHPNSYINALRTLPKNFVSMFIHSLQSYIFNIEVFNRLENELFGPFSNERLCKNNKYGFPDVNSVFRAEVNTRKRTKELTTCINLVGYQSKTNEIEQDILESLNIKTENFKIKEYPEISSKGTFRPLIVPVLDYEVNSEQRKDTGKIKVRFILPPGSYATMLLKTLEDKNSLLLK